MAIKEKTLSFLKFQLSEILIIIIKWQPNFSQNEKNRQGERHINVFKPAPVPVFFLRSEQLETPNNNLIIIWRLGFAKNDPEERNLNFTDIK